MTWALLLAAWFAIQPITVPCDAKNLPIPRGQFVATYRCNHGIWIFDRLATFESNEQIRDLNAQQERIYALPKISCPGDLGCKPGTVRVIHIRGER